MSDLRALRTLGLCLIVFGAALFGAAWLWGF